MSPLSPARGSDLGVRRGGSEFVWKRLRALLALILTLSAFSLARPVAALEAAPQVSTAGATDKLEAGPRPLPERQPPQGWKVLHTRYLELQYPPSEEGRARQLASFGDDRVEEVMAELDLSTSRPFVVRLAPDEATFKAVQPSGPPVWAGGTAYPRLGLMVLKTGLGIPTPGRTGLETTFVHETVHLLVGEAFGERSLPRWMNEGLARYIAREFSLEEWASLSRAVLVDRLIPFSELERRFPEGEGRAELAYAQSRAFLGYLVNRFGPGLLPKLIAKMADGSTLNEALWSEVRYGLNGLEQDWQTELNRNYVWVSALTGGVTLWGFIALLLVAAWARRKAQSRDRRARWAVEEALIYGPDPEDAAAAQAVPRLRVIQGGLAGAVDDRRLERARPERLDDDLDGEEEEAGEGQSQEQPWWGSRTGSGREAGAEGGFGGRDPEHGDEGEDRPPPGGWLH